MEVSLKKLMVPVRVKNLPWADASEDTKINTMTNFIFVFIVWVEFKYFN